MQSDALKNFCLQRRPDLFVNSNHRVQIWCEPHLSQAITQASFEQNVVGQEDIDSLVGRVTRGLDCDSIMLHRSQCLRFPARLDNCGVLEECVEQSHLFGREVIKNVKMYLYGTVMYSTLDRCVCSREWKAVHAMLDD